MNKSYTAAVIGCGTIGHAHVEGYNLVDAVEVVAVVDPHLAARGQYMEDYGIPRGYANIEEMARDVTPDIISVCAWHPLHPELTSAAARTGAKAVICEKPMAISLSAADSMIEVCEAHGVKLVISHQRRFSLGWERAHELMRQKAIGEPLWVNCNVPDGLLNCGTHAIDGTRFVLDEPRAVWVMGAVERRTDRFERDTPIEDGCMGLVHMDGGLQVFVQSDLEKEGAWAGRFLIRGTEGLMDVSEARVSLFNASSNGWQQVDLGVDEKEIPAIGGTTNAAQVRELLDWIEGGPEHRGAARRARDTVEIMMALYESARRHRVIHLPLEEKEYPLEAMIEEGILPVEVPGRYDIRAFLKRDEINPEAYGRLQARGMSHSQIMEALRKEEKG